MLCYFLQEEFLLNEERCHCFVHRRNNIVARNKQTASSSTASSFAKCDNEISRRATRIKTTTKSEAKTNESYREFLAAFESAAQHNVIFSVLKGRET